MENKDKSSDKAHSEPLQQYNVSRSIFKGTDYFFSGEDEELCYPLWKHLMWAREKDEKEVTVYKAEPIKVHGYMYCNLHGAGEDGKCGKICTDYIPRNGKRGMCKHRGKLYQARQKVKFNVENAFVG